MNLQDVVNLAKSGELSNLAVKDDTDTILGYMNLGLIELYKRFPIRTSEFILELRADTDLYVMPSDFMWMVAAYDEVSASSTDTVAVLPINVEDNPLSINTVTWNTIQVPVTTDGAYISIIYVASPPVFTNLDLGKDLPIPVQMVEALLHYIGYRAHGAMDGNIQAENNTHYQRFEASCKRIQMASMFTTDDLNMANRLVNRGFV